MTRSELIGRNHVLSVAELLSELVDTRRVVYQKNISYIKGHEYLASNEFNFHENQLREISSDLIVGFGTNSVWDLALKSQSSKMIIADWSPWPIIAQAFLISPLLRIANSPAEFICMINGMPASTAANLGLIDAFRISKEFTLAPLKDQFERVRVLLNDLCLDTRINELELKFLTTYFRPRLNDNLNKLCYGPFSDLSSPNIANISYYYDERYNPKKTGTTQNVFSAAENFNKLKQMFLDGNVYYAVAEVSDLLFYQSIKNKFLDIDVVSSVAVNFSNIFECGYYNNLNFANLLELTKQIFKMYQRPLTIYFTEGRQNPHLYHQYEIRDFATISTMGLKKN